MTMTDENPLNNPMALMRLLKSEDGLEELMQEPIFPTEHGGKVSQAEVLADIINIYRMDAKKFGELHGVDISIARITPRKVAWMLSEMVNGNPAPLIECFNGIEDLHHAVFEEAIGDEVAEYGEMKKSVLYTQQADKQAKAEAEWEAEREADLEDDGDDDGEADLTDTEEDILRSKD